MSTITEPGSLRHKTIFIVEDNIQNRLVFQMTLSMSGARVEFERTGREVVTRLRALQTVDLIILDLMLFNGRSGFDVYADIRAVEAFDPVPVVAVSAMEPAIALPKTRQLGFNGFIAKPVDDELFPGQLVQILAGEQVWYSGGHYHTVAP